MKIKIPRVDGRTWQAEMKVFVKDTDTDQEIGHIENRQGSTYLKDGQYWRHPSRYICLFSGKYISISARLADSEAFTLCRVGCGVGLIF